MEIAAEGTGISLPLSENVNLLGALLGEVVAEQGGPRMLMLVEELRLLCKRAAAEGDDALLDQAAERIGTLDAHTLRWLLQAYSAFFHLVNQAEQQEILRINRERTRKGSRPESIDDAVRRLREQGYSLPDLVTAMERLDIEPTLTAHPTLRILMVSGLSPDHLRFSKLRPDRFLQKPFTPEELRMEVRAALHFV